MVGVCMAPSTNGTRPGGIAIVLRAEALMDAAHLSRYPHLSWLSFRAGRSAAAPPLAVEMRGVCHTISLTRRGHHDVRWTTRGRDRHWGEDAGAMHFRPADDADHAFLTSTPTGFESAVFCIPRGHLETSAEAEGMAAPGEWRRLLLADDAVLRWCLERLAAGGPDGDEAARRLVLRLVALGGGGVPDWHDDTSIFERRTLENLVAAIDDRLQVAPSLAEMGLRTGLSPSHFARKFRRSTGLSLERFVNRRRLQAALGRLADPDLPLAHLAHELGFSSHSHFTRLFSGLTGMTPAKYQRQHRRTKG